MKEGVAKKYVKALMLSLSESEMVAFCKDLEVLSYAFGIEKFINIISSPDVGQVRKVNLILSFLKEPSKKMTNLIKLLALNDRLELIPSIFSELNYQLALTKNQFYGQIESSLMLTDDQISSLEANFSKKFNALVKLERKQSDYAGIKIQLDDLGIKVSFSVDRLKAQMTEHILKAI